MASSNFDARIMNVVQATPHPGNIKHRNVEGYTVLMYVIYVSLLNII